MEYEQLEKLNRAVTRAIERQDSGLLHDLLAPDVLLVTHFPYPDLASSDAGVMAISETANLERKARPVSDRRRKQQLLEESCAYWRQQRARHEQLLTAQTGSATTSHRPTAATDPRPKPASNAARSRSKSAKRGTASATHAPSSKPTVYSRDPPGVSFYFDVVSKIAERKEAAAAAAVAADGKHKSTDDTAGGGGAATAPVDPDLEASLTAQERESPEMLEKALASDYAAAVDITEGRNLVSERFCLLLHWLSRGKYIAESRTQLEPLKGILQDSETMRPPPPPVIPADFFARLGRQYTERNQRLSRLTVHWGRENLLFVDQYFLLDGAVVTIQRAMVPLPEMLRSMPFAQQHLSVTQRTEKVRNEVLDFYGANRTRVNAVNAAWPLLDYSFCTLSDPVELVKATPVTGKKHVTRPVRPEVDPHLAHGVYLNEANDPTQRNQEPSKQLIKAKNKRGEEEAYEFEANGRNRFGFLQTFSHETSNNPLDAYLSDPTRVTYDAASVRIASCQLSQPLDSLVPTLRGLVSNALLTIHSLDLSDNAISVLPEDLATLPLQRLQLHANRLTDWREVETKICPLPFLHSLTLHGNPLAEQEGEKYWPMLIAKLLRHPNRLVKLRQVDFVTLTAQDYNVAGAHAMFTAGDASVLNTARKTFRS